MLDPRDVWLSQHFRLSDLLGNHSVYARGFRNAVEFDEDSVHLANAQALCEHALEPILSWYGPVSVSYGYISPEFSRKTVTYQDPDKPSHHRWDLGAAADVCVHNWVEGGPLAEPDLAQLFMDENTRTSPVALAHALDSDGIPYSRLITYSESPYICLAVSAVEVARGQPRGAFYENRYQGRPKAKPEYLQMPSVAARRRALTALQQQGLEHNWRGGGYPSYHGGGTCKYQHTRVSRYTMLLDWLFNLKSISDGVKNIAPMLSEPFLDAVAACGIVYDSLLSYQQPRLSILSGYVCRSHPDFDPANDWKNYESRVSFEVGAPQGEDPSAFTEALLRGPLPEGSDAESTERGARIHVDVEYVLSSANQR